MAAQPVKKSMTFLALAALGVVFGDIGTSPLYSFQTALWSIRGPDQSSVLGIASLIIWCLLLLVTVKYMFVVMRADYHGEGGVFALLALLQERLERADRLKLPFYTLLLLLGAALLFGDGTITPAISVLSAMEGLESVNPKLVPFVIPGTVGILAVLFSVQRFGTGRLGLVFGWVMLVWFVVLGAMGFVWIMRNPSVLQAFNPFYALEVLKTDGWSALNLMGAVILAVTGAEALYADMGHFGRKAISLAWHVVALPALVLNYLGQAALAMHNPVLYQSDADPFFSMVPQGWPTLALVVLATMATVIASQALISGVFSLTAQAQQLHFLPKFLVIHTSRHERGQVYVPTTNWLLCFACLLLVLTFRASENLAAAYGLAVVGTMLITTIAIGMVMLRCWGWSWAKVGALITGLLVIEVPFFIACMTKFPEGGFFPVLVALLLLAVMLTWHKGRAIILQHLGSCADSAEDVSRKLESLPYRRPGQIVLITSNRNPRYALTRALEMIRREGAFRERVIILSLVNAMESDVNMAHSVEVERLGANLWHIVALHGYMQEPHAPRTLGLAHEISGGKIDKDTPDTFYVLPRELIVEYVGHRMGRWQRSLFGFLSRNVSYAPDYFFIPHTQIIEFTWMLRA